MAPRARDNYVASLLTVGLLAWLVPGAGHVALKEIRRGIIIFITIVVTFVIGLYVGSIGVVNPAKSKLAYAAQVMNTPAVALLGRMTVERRYDKALGYVVVKNKYPVFGKPSEIGQIYTSIAGLLNLLCIVNAVYMAHLRAVEPAGG